MAARDANELQPILSELNELLRGHTERLKSMVAQYPFLAVKIDKPAA